MKTAKTTAPVAFGPGARLILKEEQAAPRLHALKKLGNGLYEAVAEIQFKAGETIGIEDDVPKALLASLEIRDAKKAASAASGPRAPVV